MYFTTVVPLFGHIGFEQTRDALPAFLTLTIHQKAERATMATNRSSVEPIVGGTGQSQYLIWCPLSKR